MEKRRFNVKPLIIAASVFITVALLAVTANAVSGGGLVKFLFNGREYSGGTYDYVDKEGFRHIGFEVELPTYEDNYAIIYDVDAPQGENVRTLTEETDAEFFEKLRSFHEASFNGGAKPEDFGLVLKDSELCRFRLGTLTCSSSGIFGGKFRRTGEAAGKPSGVGTDLRDDGKHVYGDGNAYGTFYDWDFENETYRPTKVVKDTIYYYVGK